MYVNFNLDETQSTNHQRLFDKFRLPSKVDDKAKSKYFSQEPLQKNNFRIINNKLMLSNGTQILYNPQNLFNFQQRYHKMSLFGNGINTQIMRRPSNTNNKNLKLPKKSQDISPPKKIIVKPPQKIVNEAHVSSIQSKELHQINCYFRHHLVNFL